MVGPPKAQAPVNRAVTSDLVNALRQVVQRNNRRWKRLIILEALGLSIAVPLGCFLLLILLDHVIHLPSWGRYAACLVTLGTVGWFACRLSRQWRQVSFTEDQVALAMERHSEGTDNRLINAIQIAREASSADGDLGRAVIEENYQRLRDIELHQASGIGPAMIRISAAAMLVLVGAASWFFQPSEFKNSFLRVMNPFEDIKPIYRTELAVEPGDAQTDPGGSVMISVNITGKRPSELVIHRTANGANVSEVVPVTSDHMTYTFKNLEHSMTYTVQGGDFRSPSFAINVPTPPQINLVKVTYHYPGYTRLPDARVESAGADLEALFGTRATLTFVLDQPSDQAMMLLEKVVPPPDPKRPSSLNHIPSQMNRVELTRKGPTEYTGEILFKDVLAYRLETRQGAAKVHESPKYNLHILADQSPSLTLTGLNRNMEIQTGAILPLKIVAGDDYGLTDVALFCFKHKPGEKGAEDWKPIMSWKVAGSAREFQANYALAAASLGVAEGDRVDVVLRAMDTDPSRAGEWVNGERCTLAIGGDGAALQVLYEQILRTEKDIQAHMAAQEECSHHADEWARKLDPASGLRWDDQKNLEDLSLAMKEQVRVQDALRLSVGAAAREMTPVAGNLRMSLGLLADMEMVRAIHILEAVTTRDNPQEKQSALAEARLTQERTVRGMNELLGAYVKFRQDWEQANMTPFTKMLAERQMKLRAETGALEAQAPDGASAELVQRSTGQRQEKLLHLSTLAQTAFAGIAGRVALQDPVLGHAYADAANAFDSSGLKTQMQQAGADAVAGRWKDAAAHQAQAGETLAGIYAALKKAEDEAVLRVAGTRTPGMLEKPGEPGALEPGSLDTPVTRKDTPIVSIVHQQDPKQAPKSDRKGDLPEFNFGELKVTPELEKFLTLPLNEHVRPDTGQIKVAESPTSGTFMDPFAVGLKPNAVTAPSVPGKTEVVMGPKLKEPDTEDNGKYSSNKVNTAATDPETGTIGKGAGRINSFGDTAQIGNEQPPLFQAGGATESGRTGARSNGLNLGDTASSESGRENPLEGDENSPDAPGMLKEPAGADTGKPPPGRGGKPTDSKKTQYSESPNGEWNKDDAKRMRKADDTFTIVDRPGKPVDPKIIATLYDHETDKFQVLQRVKTLRKELKGLFLPNEKMIEEDLSNIERKLRETSDADVFVFEKQVLNRVEGLVLNWQPVSTVEASVPRSQGVRGDVHDQPPSQANPGYEEAVKYYYERLVNR